MIRNAGGVVTDDVVRSLVISQRLLDTERIVLLHHTDCGLLKITEDEFREALRAGRRDQARPGRSRPSTTSTTNMRQSIARVRANPFIPRRDDVRGFIYDVETGDLREVQ